MRSEKNADKNTVCTLDCPDTCSLSVSVKDKEILKIRGSYNNPYTAGVICSKVAKYFPDYVHGKYRLTQPLKRVGKRNSHDFKPISWQQALDEIYTEFSQRIEKYGSETVMPLNFAGPHGKLACASLDRSFFNALGATELSRDTFCAGVRSLAYKSLFGNVSGMAPEYALQSDVIAVWGNNATISNLHFAKIIKQARQQGTKIVVVDPKRIKIAQQADCYLQIKPDTDVILALGVIHALVSLGRLDQDFIDNNTIGSEQLIKHASQYCASEVVRQCGITLNQFERLVDIYANATNLSLAIGNGIERGRNGGSSLRAIMSINVLLGQIGRPGAGIIANHGAAFPFQMEKIQRPDLSTQPRRTVNIVDASKVLLDKQLTPPVTALFIYNHNPVCTHPDQNRMRRALSQEDIYIVGCDVVMTDSMRYADIILPAASQFEFKDIYGAYGQTYLQYSDAVINPLGEALPNTEIFRRLAKRFGFDDEHFSLSDNELIAKALDFDHDALDNKKWEQLKQGHAINCQPRPDTLQIKTSSGKIELYSQALEQAYQTGVPQFRASQSQYKFQLISPASMQRSNSTFAQNSMRFISKTPEQVEIHPKDANQERLENGSIIQLYNHIGQVSVQVKISDAVQPGVLYVEKGAWLVGGEQPTINALLDADVRTDILDAACYNETFVNIRII